MNEQDNESSEDLNSLELTQNILREVKPYLQPGKVDEAEQHIGTFVVQELHQEFHKGPLPSARQLVQYEQVLPGAAERIFVMAEKEQNHRHLNEGRLVKGDLRLKTIGQIMAFVLVICTILLVGFLAWLGYPVQAASLGVVVITGVAGVFLAPKFFQRPPAIVEAPAKKSAKQGKRRR